jgi:hypothetical protein
MTKLNTNTVAFSATVEFRQMKDGKLGPALDWAIGEGESWAEVLDNARQCLIRAGVEQAAKWTALGVKVNQQWDAQGRAI